MSPGESAAGKPDGKKPAGRWSGGRRRILVWVAVCMVVATAVITSLRTKQRVEHETAFCTSSCHHESELAKDGVWHTTGHRDVECQSCHTTATSTGFKLAWQAFVGSAHPVTHGKATAGACVSCHQKQPADWRVIAETRGHREHRGVKGVDCLSCHASGTHKEVAPAAICITCHDDQRLHKPTTANAETCLSCHGYTASQKNAREPSTLVCEKCHADPKAMLASAGTAPLRPINDVTDHVVHGGVACQLCHNAHGKKLAAPAGQPVCAKCHQFEVFQVGTEERKGPEGHRKCEGCHKPHAPLTTALQSCVECHEKNAKGLIGVKGAAKAGAAIPANALTKAVGGTTALKHDSCASCHLPHTWRAERSGCMQCHKTETQKFLTRSPAEHTTCVTCHEVHGPAPSGAVCVKCHAKTKGNHVALAPQKHKDCTSCHDPHAPKPSDTRTACAKCHTVQVSQVSLGPQAHSANTCLGCHQPHENPLPQGNVCAKCHADKTKVVATAGPPKHRLCVSCHEKHTFKITNVATACSKCHGTMFPAATTAAMGTPATGKVPHGGDCKGCHTVHGSPGVPQTSCLKCHGKVATEFNPPNEKHGVCRSCHQPHTPASAAVATCATCHAAKADIAKSWPPTSAHAKACNGCHQQHDVRVKKVCADCHAAETASAMGGKHQCVGCHAPHAAPPGTGPAWWTKCNQCHAAKVQSATLRGPTHSVCKNCHQPHKFAVPTCASCHKDMGAKGLHAVPKHTNCASCHDPHVKSLPSPAQCLACHTTRRNHEPTATACQACHPFK